MIVLPVAVDGPLKGYTSVRIDLDALEKYKESVYSAHVGYEMGAKDPHCGSGSVDYSAIDCSGFARTVLMYCSRGVLCRLPDGSATQNQWFAAHGFKHGDYKAYEANAGNSDGFLRIAIHRPGGRGNDPIGHVWLLVNGHSVESFGGHGPGERPWNHQWFIDHVDDIFVVGQLESPYIQS